MTCSNYISILQVLFFCLFSAFTGIISSKGAQEVRREVPEMNGSERRELPWWQKYTLTLNEASEYFGIGYKC